MSAVSSLRRMVVGRPIATKHAEHERLRKRYGLAVFSSDALSSTAYATEEVLLILITGASVAAYTMLFPISIVLAIVLLIVASSYYQTIHAYPEGGGSYTVSKENLGFAAGKVAAAALLIDYILTVAVSVSSGIAALVSAFPAVQGFEVLIACLVISVVAVINLRGARESGIVFAVPTYAFVGFTLVLVANGLIHGVGRPAVQPVLDPGKMVHPITLFFVLRAFAGVCAAMTGIEAISNGVMAFRKPEARNASITLWMMATLLLSMVVGVSWCAQHYGIVPIEPGSSGYQTVVAQIATRLFGTNWVFYGMQISTMLILFLAANTAFADFPRLSSIIARDKLLPRQLMNLGDRLVFNNGIILLAFISIVLVVAFRADTHALIPLYAVGVFTAFTLSQAGMVVRWKRMRRFGLKMAVNVIGALTTALVTVVIAYTKFAEGAWMVVIAIGVVLFVFTRIKRYYDYLQESFEVKAGDFVEDVRSTVLLLVPRVNKGTLEAIAYAKSVGHQFRAIHVTTDFAESQRAKEHWIDLGIDAPLVILDSPYRSLVEPVTEYIDDMIDEDPERRITVIVPQGVPPKWFQAMLHSNVATMLKLALSSRRNVIVTNVRYFL